jgi:hypothetical protein
MKRPLETQYPATRAGAKKRANSNVRSAQNKGMGDDQEVGGARVLPERAAAVRKGVRKVHTIDFDGINQAALAALPVVLAHILPGGKRVGAELVALNPRRADRRLGSFKINRYTGRWADFATGDKGGDPISLVAYLANVSQGEAARLLARMLGRETKGRRRG